MFFAKPVSGVVLQIVEDVPVRQRSLQLPWLSKPSMANGTAYSLTTRGLDFFNRPKWDYYDGQVTYEKLHRGVLKLGQTPVQEEDARMVTRYYGPEGYGIVIFLIPFFIEIDLIDKTKGL